MTFGYQTYCGHELAVVVIIYNSLNVLPIHTETPDNTHRTTIDC